MAGYYNIYPPGNIGTFISLEGTPPIVNINMEK